MLFVTYSSNVWNSRGGRWRWMIFPHLMFWWWGVENTVKHVATKSPIAVLFGWDLVIMTAIAYDSQPFHTHQTIQWQLCPALIYSYLSFNRPFVVFYVDGYGEMISRRLLPSWQCEPSMYCQNDGWLVHLCEVLITFFFIPWKNNHWEPFCLTFILCLHTHMILYSNYWMHPHLVG